MKRTSYVCDFAGCSATCVVPHEDKNPAPPGWAAFFLCQAGGHIGRNLVLCPEHAARLHGQMAHADGRGPNSDESDMIAAALRWRQQE